MRSLPHGHDFTDLPFGPYFAEFTLVPIGRMMNIGAVRSDA